LSFLPAFDTGPNVEDHQVRVEGVEVKFRGVDQYRATVSSDGPVFDFEIGMREAFAQIVGDNFPPRVESDRLAIEEDAHRVAFLRCARSQQGHGALDLRTESAWVAVGLRLGEGWLLLCFQARAEGGQGSCKQGCQLREEDGKGNEWSRA
jgi:hypothetical protein